MKALILAAGLGTRLDPYTRALPKALFPLAGIPVLQRMIDNLKRAGCSAIAVNAHHLAERIEDFLTGTDFGLPVTISREPQICGTGGAIRRLAHFWDKAPFWVVNADIVTDIDLAGAYRRHCDRNARVTLVMHDRQPFNQVWVGNDDRISGFARFSGPSDRPGLKKMAFTGLQIMDARIIPWIPADRFSDIISVYAQMIDAGVFIHGHVVQGHYWQDIGNPERFRQAVVDAMAPGVFKKAFANGPTETVGCRRLCGDGSDREWYRLKSGRHTLVMADHGITTAVAGSEVNALVNIGTHLHSRGLPVPRIYASDGFSGLVFMEDLGNGHLQNHVRRASDPGPIERLYRSVIDTWLALTVKATEGFDPRWTCQSRAYDIPLILERECRYFVEAFLNGYLGQAIAYDDLAAEFETLARCTVDQGISGLIHRDFQSRNIMIRDGQAYLIDFQGARFGPIQYDLASLLIDPYADLDPTLRQRLLAYAVDHAACRLECDPNRFLRGYRYCTITRNLQMLGAFGFLSRVKQKTEFERWIPAAASMLVGHIRAADDRAFPQLTAIAREIAPDPSESPVAGHFTATGVKREEAST